MSTTRPPRLSLIILCLGTGALVLTHTLPLLMQPYADWAAASAESRQALVLALVWAGACAAWSASSEQPVAGQVVRLATAGVIGQIAGLAPLYVWCGVRSTYPADLRPLVILGGIAVLVAGVAVGHLCGTVLPRAAAVLAAAALLVAPGSLQNGNGAPWSPVWPFLTTAGTAETTEVGAFRLLFFAALAGLCIVAARCWVTGPGGTAVPALVVTLLPAFVLAWLGTATTAALIRPDRVEPTCEQSRSLRVCVHPAAADVLPTLTAGLEDLRSGFGRRIAFPGVVTDGTPTDDDHPLVIDVEPDQEAWRARAMVSAADGVLGTDTCLSSVRAAQEGAATTGGAALWFASLADAQVPELLGKNPASDVARRLMAGPVDETGDRLRTAVPDLVACRAHEEQLEP